MERLIKPILPYVFLSLMVSLGYWQITMMMSGLKWDLIDVVFPFRYFFSESFQSGHFPYWNPYQQTGTPYYADLQAPTYYPELLLTSLFGGYSIYKMHFLYTLYLSIASWGMYRLSRYFKHGKLASIVAAIIYCFSGYLVGHGQHFFLLVGAAWVPFVIRSYLLLCENKSGKDALYSGLFVFLLLTGAYQALSIAMFYLLILIFIYFLWQSIKQGDKSSLRKLLFTNFLFTLITLLLSSPLLYSSLEILSSVDRLSSGVPLERTLSFNQPVATLISLLFPFATTNPVELFNDSDASLINYYMGLIPLLLFIPSFFYKRTKIELLIVLFGIAILLLNFDFIPLREVTYQYVPLMDKFLSAAYIRCFAFIAFSLSVSFMFSKLSALWIGNKKIIIGVLFTTLLLMGWVFSWAMTVSDVSSFKQLYWDFGFFGMFENMVFEQQILVQSGQHIILLIAAIAALVLLRKPASKQFALVLIISIDLILAAQLNFGTTVLDKSFYPSDMEKSINIAPKGFPVPNNSKVIYNDQQHAYFAPYWRNTYTFSKQVAFDAFSSFELDSYRKLDDEFPMLKQNVINNHLIYFSDTIAPISRLNSDEKEVMGSSSILYLNDEDYHTLKSVETIKNSEDQVDIVQFKPDLIELKTYTENSQFLTMLQTVFPGWVVYIDGQETNIFTSNFNYRTILLPSGVHTVKFKYKNAPVLTLYIFSNALFLSLIILLIGFETSKMINAKAGLAVSFSLVLILIVLFTRVYYNSDVYSKGDLVVSTPYMSVEPEISKERGRLNHSLIDSTIEVLPIIEYKQGVEQMKEGLVKVDFCLLSNEYCTPLFVSDVNGSWHADKVVRQIEKVGVWQDMTFTSPIPVLNNGEIVKLYLWNVDKSNFQIKDIKVSFHEY